MPRIRSTRSLVLLGALALGGSLVACGGADSTPPAGDDEGGAEGTAGGTSCNVTGPVTGDAREAYVNRPGTVALDESGDAPPAFYTFEGDASVLYLYAEGPAPASIVFTATTDEGEVTFGSDSTTTGVDIAADGSGATLTGATLRRSGGGGGTVTLDLAVTCSG